MKAIVKFGLIAVAAIGIVGCTPKAQNETAEAADTIAADSKATMTEAANDTEAASDKAFGAAENTIDGAGEKIGNVSEAIGNEIEE